MIKIIHSEIFYIKINCFAGITSKLEYFCDAGVGAIWLSPIYKSPMVDFGYDIQDFRAIDERFGTLDDFTKLTKTAKQLGIKVININCIITFITI